MTVSAVGFDLDETLAAPDRDRRTLLRNAVEAVDAPPISREEYLAAHADNLTAETREPVFAALVDAGTAGDLAAAYRDRVTAALDPVPGVESMVAGLRATYRVGLLTNGPSVAQAAKIEALGWTDAFDAVLVSGDLEAGKPDRRAFAALLEALDTGDAETVYVGDDPAADVGGADAAGLQTVQVLYEGGPDPDPRATATVARDELASRLPDVLAEL